MQLGYGASQRRVWTAETDLTSAIGKSIAHDKDLTKKLLRAAGMPVVLKPQDGNQGKGVTVNITTRAQVDMADRAAAEHGEVLVEKFLPGCDFRLLVVGDALLTAHELVDTVNQDPRRGEGRATLLTKIRFDDIAMVRLQAQGLTAESIPARGQRVILRNNANLSTGGTATDVTDEVHPAIAAQVVAAAQTIGLDICGVDVVCESMLRPLQDQHGRVVEVNAAPGLRTGMTNTDGVYINGRQTDSGDCSGPKSARNVSMHPDVDAAGFEVARGGMLREGLGFDRCQLAVVTNIGSGDHLGLNYITTVEDLAVLKRVVVQNVAPGGYAVLNAADAIVSDMAWFAPAR